MIVLKSQVKLFYAFWKSIRNDDGSIQPSPPLKLFKQATQYTYNKSKPGLDKNTELANIVAYPAALPFETKYVFRLIDAVLINSWRATQAVGVLMPWITSLQNTPTIFQMRNKVKNEGSLERFLYDVAITNLKKLEQLRVYNVHGIVDEVQHDSETEEDRQILQAFLAYKAKAKKSWPHKRDVIRKFHSESVLKNLRLYKSN